MLLSPSCAFNRSTTEVWLDTVNEIYPCRLTVQASSAPAKAEVGRKQISRLRAMQGSSFVECVREQYAALKQALAPLARKVAYGALAFAHS